jgi:hypothetical protein
MTGFFYAFTPVFVLIEIRSSMKDPSQCKKALNISTSIQICLYLLAGIMGLVFWGYNVQDPITIEIPRGWLGILLSVVVALATLLDYCYAAKISNDWVRSKLFPNWSNSDIGSTLIYTLLTHDHSCYCMCISHRRVPSGSARCINLDNWDRQTLCPRTDCIKLDVGL